MKIACALISLLAASPACAFTTAPRSPAHTVLRSTTLEAEAVKAEASKEESVKKTEAVKKPSEEKMIKYNTDVNPEQKFKVKDVDPKILDPKVRVQTGRYNDKEMSIAMPMLKRPTNLDGTHAGDVGFDPLGFSENNDMYTMMEAELRHARLAMLAVVGWPLSELNAPNWLLHGKAHLAPSVLNGFDPLTFIGVAAIFGGFGYFEYKTSLRRVDDKPLGKKHSEDMANVWKYGVPGDYNFDPLDLYNSFGDSADGRKAMRELEIAHGRSAMLGITGFAVWEALTGHPIVENSMFFHPNLFLPAAAVAYLGFGFFYEVENDGQYMFQVKESSEGSVRIERIKNGLKYLAEDAKEYLGIASEYAVEYAGKAAVTSKDLKEKYENVTEDYTKSVMSKNYEVEK